MSTGSDLATARSARDLVPGDPGTLTALADALGTYGADLSGAARAMAGLGPASWSGPAAEAFRARFLPAPHRWGTAADAFAAASRAVHVYATSLLLAQDDVADALARYRRTTDAPARAFSPVGVLFPAASPADDAAAAGCRRAEVAVEDARARVRAAGAVAHNAVRAAAATAPAGPSWWARSAGGVATFGTHAARTLYDGALVPTVNVVASLTTTAAHDPAASLALVGGAVLTVLGVAGDGAGVALTATGVGAVAGVPLTAAGCAVVAAGVVVAGGAAARLTYEAQQQRVQVLHRVGADSPAPPPTPDADRIRVRLQELPRGIQRQNRQVADADALSNLWDELSVGGTDVPSSSAPGRRMVVLPDDTRLVWRDSSLSGGPTIEVLRPETSSVIKVHLAGGQP